MNAYDIKIECEEDGFWLVVDGDSVPGDIYGATEMRWRIENPEALYDQVKARIGPWLRERDEARATMPAYFACDPDESGGYDVSDPKHPDYHSVHADIWDAREGK